MIYVGDRCILQTSQLEQFFMMLLEESSWESDACVDAIAKVECNEHVSKNNSMRYVALQTSSLLHLFTVHTMPILSIHHPTRGASDNRSVRTFSCLIGCCEVILFVLLPPTPISRPPFASLCTAWLTLHQTVPKHFR